MTSLDRPCLGAWNPQTNENEPCGVPAPGGRCVRHAALYDAQRRVSPSRRGYDRQYRRDRAVLLAPDPLTGERPLCALGLPGCTTFADTADHPIPVDGGRNALAFRQPLRPACAHCNYARGKRGIDAAVDMVKANDARLRLEAEVQAALREAKREIFREKFGVEIVFEGEDDDAPWHPDP